jgi:hypothetical protein
MGAKVLHGINVKSMERHSYLERRLFHRIVFNFPHAGFLGRECDMIKYVHLNLFLRTYLCTAVIIWSIPSYRYLFLQLILDYSYFVSSFHL